MTAKQEQALAALMTHATRKEAAKAAGIGERTLRLYFKNPEFRKRYREACFEVMEDAALQSKRILQKALTVFEEIMDDPEEKNSVRCQAADRAGEYALRLDEAINIRRELEELREAVFPDEHQT